MVAEAKAFTAVLVEVPHCTLWHPSGFERYDLLTLDASYGNNDRRICTVDSHTERTPPNMQSTAAKTAAAGLRSLFFKGPRDIGDLPSLHSKHWCLFQAIATANPHPITFLDILPAYDDALIRAAIAGFQRLNRLGLWLGATGCSAIHTMQLLRNLVLPSSINDLRVQFSSREEGREAAHLRRGGLQPYLWRRRVVVQYGRCRRALKYRWCRPFYRRYSWPAASPRSRQEYGCGCGT